MAIIADLITKLKLDATQLHAGLASAGQKMTSFSNKAKVGMLAVAAVIGGALIGAFHTLAEVISEQEKKISDLVDTSTRLGAGIPELQRLQYAAGQSGMSIETLNKGLGIMEKNLGNAARAGDSAKDAFGRIGLKASELAAMGIDQQYLAISEAIKTLPTPAAQAAAAMAIFGRAGITQLSLLKDNVGGLIGEFKSLGIELTDNQARSVEAYGDSVKRLDAIWEGFKAQLTVAVIPALEELIKWIQASVISMGGMGPVAKAVGEGIVSGLQVAFVILQGLKNAVDIVIIAFDVLAATALKSFRVASLGLADLTTNIAATQKRFEQDAIDRGRGIVGLAPQQPLGQNFAPSNSGSPAAQATQQKVDVSITADEGLIARVVNSSQNDAKINNTVASAMNNAARGEQR